jgi:hypothetical protein
MAERKVVFILGSGHSGSTLLDLILGSHPDVFGLGELVNLARAVDAPVEDFPHLCYVCDGRCPFWNDRADVDVLRRYFSRRGLLSPLTRGLSRMRRSVYEHFFEWSGRPVLIDSSKGVSWIRQQLRPRCHWVGSMEPILLYIRRDGRAVVNSRLRKYPGKRLEDEVLHWKRNVVAMNDYYGRFPFPRKHSVRYEDLTARPEEVVEGLCGALGLRYEPAMLRYWEHEHHTTFGNTGTRSLIFRYRAALAGAETAGQHPDLQEVRGRHGAHYDSLGLGIRPDTRWQKELSEEQLAVFEALAGEVNRTVLGPGE